MVKTWFEQIPNISKNKPKPSLRKRSESRCSKCAPRTNSNKNEAWKTFMFSSPGEAQPYEHTKDFTKTPVYLCFMGNYTDWGWGEIFSQQLTPKFSFDTQWEVASVSTQAYRGNWGLRRVSGGGLTGEVCSDLLCCVLFPASTTWRYLAVEGVCEPIFEITREKNYWM